MAEYTVYHNPRCSKSRMAVQYLEAEGKSFDVVEYLKEIPSAEELDQVLNLLGMEPEELLRKNEADFKENFKGKELSRSEWIEAMRAYPKIIERPIVIKGKKAVVARPTEKIVELD
ncbi:MAG: arsenate reductase (glutaredoxin) [bacterium]|nr:arsenate reductase (glutaredoxin) [bacterium]